MAGGIGTIVTMSCAVAMASGAAAFDFALAVDIPIGDLCQGVAAADLNMDGAIDLVVTASGSDTVSVLMNLGDGTFAEPVPYAVGAWPIGVAAGDINGDEAPDLVVVNEGDENATVLFNNGAGLFGEDQPLILPLRRTPHSVILADLDDNGDLDIAITNRQSHTIAVWLNEDGELGPRALYYTGSELRGLDAGDVDGDGDLDIVAASTYGDNIRLLRNNGDGTFEPTVPFEAGKWTMDVSLANLDGDDDLDVACAVFSSEHMATTLENLGDGDFADFERHPVGTNPTRIVAADYDLDGDHDLAVTIEVPSSVAMLANNGDATFDDVELLPASADNARGLVAADLDGDGDLDLATANFFGGSASVLINNRLDAACRADLDGDRTVDFNDILPVLSSWGPCDDEACVPDIDRNGVVDFNDILAVLDQWGPCA